jgi:hypothetical protein
MVILVYKWLLLWPALFGGGHLTQGPNNAAAHPLFISVTEINHNAADKNLEISCKIFTDDFEKTLTNIYHTKVDLSAPANKSEADKMVKEYIKSHLHLKLDGKPVTLEYVGFFKWLDGLIV